MRTLIVGPPAAGKSTLARALTTGSAGLPVHHVDQLRWIEPRVRRSGDLVMTAARNAAADDAWVAEGCLGPTVNVFAEAADIVIFLDYPRRVTTLRLFRRWVSRERVGMPSGHRERPSVNAVRFVLSWPTSARPTLANDLARLAGANVVRIRKPRRDLVEVVRRHSSRTTQMPIQPESSPPEF